MAETLEEDRELVLFAEELGFSEGYVGEHITDAAETVNKAIAPRPTVTARSGT
jgi:hypothetical protein